MATKRERRTRPIREEVPEGIIEHFLTGELACFECFTYTDDKMRSIWSAHRDDIIADYVRKHPGRRPHAWWRYDSPREAPPPDTPAWIAERITGQRKRLGGKGQTAMERYPNTEVPAFDRGIPAFWHEIDADDPPVFESQAAFLLRHDLLLPGEKKRIKAKDWEPETIDKEEADE